MEQDLYMDLENPKSTTCTYFVRHLPIEQALWWFWWKLCKNDLKSFKIRIKHF